MDNVVAKIKKKCTACVSSNIRAIVCVCVSLFLKHVEQCGSILIKRDMSFITREKGCVNQFKISEFPLSLKRIKIEIQETSALFNETLLKCTSANGLYY